MSDTVHDSDAARPQSHGRKPLRFRATVVCERPCAVKGASGSIWSAVPVNPEGWPAEFWGRPPVGTGGWYDDGAFTPDPEGGEPPSAAPAPAPAPDPTVVGRLRDARELLSEARRYAGCDPVEACRLVRAASDVIAGTVPAPLADRLGANLGAGVRAVRCDPDVFRGYCHGASYELLAFGGAALCPDD